MSYLFGYLVVGEQGFESSKNWNSELYNISFHLYHTFQLHASTYFYKALLKVFLLERHLMSEEDRQ